MEEIGKKLFRNLSSSRNCQDKMEKGQDQTRFVYGTPAWGSKLICLLFISFSIFLIGLFTCLDAEEPGSVRWLVLFLGVVCLFLGANPAYWRASIFFYADGKGLYFPILPSYGFAYKIKGWLKVPWSHVGEIRLAKTMDGAGVLLALQLTEEEISRGFPNSLLERKLLKRPLRVKGFFEIAFENAFQQNDDVVQKLNEMKKLSK